jgi:Immunity protein 35
MLLKEARKKALEFVNRNYEVIDDELVIVDEETIEKDYGWYFFSASRKFLKTENISDMALGNGPILVAKDGKITQFGTAYSIEHYVREYENS